MPAASIAEVVDLYRRWGTQRYDEEVTQLDHALQTAAHARADRAEPPLVAAALLRVLPTTALAAAVPSVPEARQPVAVERNPTPMQTRISCPWLADRVAPAEQRF